MKMSKENYDRLTAFYNYTVENATDMEVSYILRCIYDCADYAAKQCKKHEKKHGKN